MDDIERLRTEAEAHRSMAGSPGGRWPHEDLLLRYLGVLGYRSRRSAIEGDRQETGGAQVRRDDAVDGVSPPQRRRWWRRAQ